MSNLGVLGICRSTSQLCPPMACTHTPTPTSKGRLSILVFLLARSLAIQQTVVPAAMIVQMSANQAVTVKRRSRSVQMLTATVGVLCKLYLDTTKLT